MGELYSAYKEAVYAINQRLLKGWGRAFVYETEKNRSSVSFPNEESALEDALKRMDFEDARKVIGNILNDPRLREQGNSYDLYEQVVHILGVFMRYYDRLSSDQGGDDSVRLLFSQRYDLYNFKHMDELEAYLLSIVQGICCQAKRESDGDDIIRSIIDYIDRSYQYDITLQELAEKVLCERLVPEPPVQGQVRQDVFQIPDRIPLGEISGAVGEDHPQGQRYCRPCGVQRRIALHSVLPQGLWRHAGAVPEQPGKAGRVKRRGRAEESPHGEK